MRNTLVTLGITFALTVLGSTNALALEKIFFDSNRHGNKEIYMMNPDGSNVVRITNTPEDELDPSLSPDGSRIVFSTHRNGAADIYIMNADGTNQVRLTSNVGDDYGPSFSPDGSKIIYFARGFITDDWDVWTMNVDGSNPVPLTNHIRNDLEATYSPDGSKIVFYSSRDSNDEIYIMNADGTGQTRLTVAGSFDRGPAFSADGTKITWYSNRTGSNEIWIMNVDGSGQTRVTNDALHDWFPVFSPDGTKIAFATLSGGVDEIYTINIDGTGRTNLTNMGLADDFLPSWHVIPDDDGDDVANYQDNCINNANPGQEDTDNDGIGDVCDNAAPVAQCSDRTVTLGFGETHADADINNGSSDPDDDSLSSTYSPAGPYPVGQTQVTLTVDDGRGETDSCTATVSVLYNFAGFFQPVDNLPTLNIVTAGQAVPLKFSLGGNYGLNILAAGYPVSGAVACDANEPAAEIEETVNAGASALTYDATTDRYSYVWKTNKAWKGTCRIMVIKLNDGTEHFAKFRFK